MRTSIICIEMLWKVYFLIILTSYEMLERIMSRVYHNPLRTGPMLIIIMSTYLAWSCVDLNIGHVVVDWSKGSIPPLSWLACHINIILIIFLTLVTGLAVLSSLVESAEYEVLIFPWLSDRAQVLKAFHKLCQTLISELAGLRDMLNNIRNNTTHGNCTCLACVRHAKNVYSCPPHICPYRIDEWQKPLVIHC